MSEAAAPHPAAEPDAHEERISLALSSLMGDTRDFLLDRLKHDHSALPWNLRGQEDQQRAIEQAGKHAERIVREVYGLALSAGRPTIVGKITKLAKKDRIEAVVAVDGLAPLRHALMDATGKECLVILADTDLVMGDRGAPKVNPDQGRLFGGDDDGDDDGPVFDNTPSGQ